MLPFSRYNLTLLVIILIILNLFSTSMFCRHHVNVRNVLLCTPILVDITFNFISECDEKLVQVFEGNKAFFLCLTCKEKETVRDGSFLLNCKSTLARIILVLCSFTQITWTDDQGNVMKFRSTIGIFHFN